MGRAEIEYYSLDVRASHGKKGSCLVKAKRLHLVCFQERITRRTAHNFGCITTSYYDTKSHFQLSTTAIVMTSHMENFQAFSVLLVGWTPVVED